MPISREEVEHVAHLSRLELSDAEMEHFAEQIGAILDFVRKLDELDTEGVQPMVHGIAGTQPVRDDSVGESLPRPEAIANAPDAADGCFRVPRIID